LKRIFDAWWSLELIQNIISHEMEGCGLHKEKIWRGLCTSLPFFFLEIEQEGEGNGRRGAASSWALAPWCMATPGEEGKIER
jgi:hypothetical protein